MCAKEEVKQDLLRYFVVHVHCYVRPLANQVAAATATQCHVSHKCCAARQNWTQVKCNDEDDDSDNDKDIINDTNNNNIDVNHKTNGDNYGSGDDHDQGHE